MGQLVSCAASCVAGTLAGCCFREIESLVEERVAASVRQEAQMLRAELRACGDICCQTRRA